MKVPLGTAFAAALACAGLLAPGPAASQTQARSRDVAAGPLHSDVELTRAVLRTERQAIVANAIELTQAEAERFWPLYREYHGERDKLSDRTAKLVLDYSERYPNVSGQEAEEMLDEYLEVQSELIELKRRYLAKFRKVLPQIKVTRYYQVENKLDSAVNMELAKSIPLIW